MNKRFLAIAGAVLLLGMISAGALHWYGNIEARLKAPTEQEMYKTAVRIGEVRDRPASPVVPLNPKRVVRLAVGNVGLASAEANARVSDLLLAQLSGATGLEMVDRQSLDKVLRELRLNIGGLVRAGEAVRAGKLLRADWFLLGTPLHVGATNNIMVRIVDARTGIFRETALIPIGAGPASIAIQLAGFIGQCRAKASTSNAPVYLALGALQDLSLNNRLAEFPTQLRSWLMAAYQDSRFTMLENRDFRIRHRRLRYHHFDDRSSCISSFRVGPQIVNRTDCVNRIAGQTIALLDPSSVINPYTNVLSGTAGRDLVLNPAIALWR
jgi:hypothetical protein